MFLGGEVIEDTEVLHNWLGRDEQRQRAKAQTLNYHLCNTND